MTGKLVFRTSVFFIVVISFFAIISCSTTEPQKPVQTAIEPVKNYPSTEFYNDQKFTEFKTKFDEFVTTYNCNYEFVQFDSLIVTIKLLQAGKRYATLYPENNDKQKKYSEDELVEGIRRFFTRWTSIFNITGEEAIFDKLEDSGDFYDISIRKNYPAGRPFVNGEFNTIRMIVSKNGEIGYIMNSCLPSLPMPEVLWIDPEVGRLKLQDHKISYEKNNKSNLYIVKSLGNISAGTQTSIVLIRRRQDSNDLFLNLRNVELRYHFAWMYYITPEQSTTPLFRVYVDAVDGEILESYYLGNP